mgnify:CR=1 FL=1
MEGWVCPKCGSVSVSSVFDSAITAELVEEIRRLRGAILCLAECRASNDIATPSTTRRMMPACTCALMLPCQRHPKMDSSAYAF